REDAYQKRIIRLGNELLADSDEVFKPVAERDLEFRSESFSMSPAAHSAMQKDISEFRNLHVARMAAEILAIPGVGRVDEQKRNITFERPKGQYRLNLDMQTGTLTVTAKARNEVILTAVNGEVQHGSSKVSDLDKQTFTAFLGALKERANQKAVVGQDR
ncbi:MAG: hypothetical protein D6694_07505, partial [Gammaproteobacteria bacterium]